MALSVVQFTGVFGFQARPLAAQPDASQRGPDVVAVVDVTEDAKCQVQYIEYADTARTRILSDTGTLTCAGRAGVTHSFLMARVDADVAGLPYAAVTGNAATDRAALSSLTAAVALASGALAAGAPRSGNASSSDVSAAATQCNSGSYPAYYVAQGSYLTYRFDGGPIDARVFYKVYYDRVTCSQYVFQEARQWLSRTPQQVLVWSDYWYEDPQVGIVETWPCVRMIYPNTRYSFPRWGYNFSRGTYFSRTTNDR